ncbi:MAG: TonB-dependent receptor [Elusimicrobia bacterium]|nr:TonB-dependent receptor [Elusimicrobiota bacterium]
MLNKVISTLCGKKIFSILLVLTFMGIIFAEETSVYIGLRKDVPVEKNPTNISVVNENDIIESDSGNVGEVLNTTTGITEVSKLGTIGSESTMRIRSGGDSSKQVLVMVDGRPVNDTSLGFANLTEIPTENIERVEVMRGPSSALYGANALGGVVNIITKKAIYEKPRTEIGYSYGSFNTKNYNMNFSAKPGKADIYLTASKNFTDGFRENSDYDNLNLSLKTGYNLGKYGDITLNNGLLNSRIGIPGTNNTPVSKFNNNNEVAASFPNAYERDKKYYNQLQHKININNITVETNIYNDYQRKRYKNPDAFTDSISQPSNLGLNLQVETLNDIVFGIERKVESFERFDLQVKTMNKIRENSAGYIQKTFEIKKLSLTPSVRYDYNSIYKESTNPRISSVYKLTDDIKLSANVGTAFRAPTFEESFSPYISWPASIWGNAGDTQGNVNIKPEKSVGTDFGIEYKKETLLSKITFFYTNVKDLIEWQKSFPTLNYEQWRPVNIGKAFSRGIEIEVQNDINKKLSQNINYTFLESMGKKTGTYKTLQYTPKHRLNYDLNYLAPKKIKANLKVEFTHRQDWEEWNDWMSAWEKHLVAGHTIVSLRLSREILQSEVFFAIDNILNKRYVSRENFPLPGRTYSTGVNLYLWD